jgi:hypothetical protein
MLSMRCVYSRALVRDQRKQSLFVQLDRDRVLYLRRRIEWFSIKTAPQVYSENWRNPVHIYFENHF